MVTVLTRCFTFLSFIILLGFALLQLNDPDSIVWTGFYLICSLPPLLLTFHIYYRQLSWLAMICCFIAIATHVTGGFQYLHYMKEEALMQSMNPEKPYIEEAREFLGALIALFIVVGCHLIYNLSVKAKIRK